MLILFDQCSDRWCVVSATSTRENSSEMNVSDLPRSVRLSEFDDDHLRHP